MKPKLLRITTISISYKALLNGQLGFMSKYFDTYAISSPGKELENLQKNENTKVHPVEIERLPSIFKDLKSLLRLIVFIRRLRPQIVHTHTPKAGLLGMIAASLVRVPVRLHTVAGVPWINTGGIKRQMLKFFERITYKFSTHVYVNSRKLGDFILNEKLISPSKLSIIGNGSSNGIDTAYFSRSDDIVENGNKILKVYKWSKDNIIILFVGRLVKDKGIIELLEAFLEINKTYRETRLLLVGPFEPKRDPLPKEVIKEIEHNPYIKTTGYVEDVRPYLAISDILAFPSYREGFPNVPMQAGSMEIPSIVTDINGCNEIIKDYETGLIVPVRDPQSLKEALGFLIQNPIKRIEFGKLARNRIVEKFDQQVLWRKLLDAYNDHLESVG